jgi:Mg-chelatase subunit ChlI
MNPEEGELRPQLLDRFGLCVNIHGIDNTDDRIEIIKRREIFESNPDNFINSWQKKEKDLGEKIQSAKKLYPKVYLNDNMLRKIVELAVHLDIDGHRGEIVMMKAAKTIAAFEQRKEVNIKDIEIAAQLCLPHRVRRKPFEDVGVDMSMIKEQIQKDMTGGVSCGIC